MPNPKLGSESLLWKYQERSGDPGFWVEPLNALTNIVFVIAAVLAWRLSVHRNAQALNTRVLILLAATVGLGSFVFHTVPNHLTLWLDIIPILLFQIGFIWAFCRRFLSMPAGYVILVLLVVIGSALLLRPMQSMNGSLFYMPPLLTMIVLGWTWAERSKVEPWTLFAASICFALAVVARSIDWEVDLGIGTHFLWHTMNGVVVYLSLRTIVLAESSD